MEEIDHQAELLLDVESSVVEAALVRQSLEVPYQNRNLWVSAVPQMGGAFLRTGCDHVAIEGSF